LRDLSELTARRGHLTPEPRDRELGLEPAVYAFERFEASWLKAHLERDMKTTIDKAGPFQSAGQWR
jgi:hypothetical protein